MLERDAYVALNLMEKVGPVTVRSLVQRLGSAAAIFETSKQDLLAVKGVGEGLAGSIHRQCRRIDWQDEQERAAAKGIRIMTRVDPEYPEALSRIYDPPLALYVRGTLQEGDKHAMAIVGTRRGTHYGHDTAKRMASGLAQAGYTIVSGLARGIDTLAHEGALEVKGRTFAVLGGGMDHLYPACNAGLADRIAEQGAVLSEFPLTRQPDRTTFPMRNRIVSGLSKAIVVVEAGRRSGALITADAALEQGRDVFAVPGRIDNTYAEGPNALIRKGAVLVRGVQDILDECGTLWGGALSRANAVPRELCTLNEEETGLLALLESGEQGVDELIRQSGLQASRVSSVLLGLEMKRMIRMLPGRVVEKCAVNAGE
ncbi:MAG: DNA-processing protein DprA [Kiritimatiellia bacterium]|jgi:DNA processing protein|nr:DNA-processing protein DprA [Kiritimatiellia bacterium]MDP6630960.1 DNA-processing protein DprA [Kiritimatiellia bacterium]MDP6810291.1 DNA-processing protein DprA [Kiritimatiellia bacterium]MDP7022720.1 DNA-processing protein DprA [Kiritimatiellia bacterium]